LKTFLKEKCYYFFFIFHKFSPDKKPLFTTIIFISFSPMFFIPCSINEIKMQRIQFFLPLTSYVLLQKEVNLHGKYHHKFLSDDPLAHLRDS